jgi:hypothetical protein
VVLALLLGASALTAPLAAAGTAGAGAAAGAGGSDATPAGKPRVPAYWLVASDGGIFSFGGAGFYGSTGSTALDKPIVGMAATADSGGYWLVASDGGVFTFGDARFYGSMGGQPLNKPIVGMAATADGGGYWLVASDGGIFCFGDAQYYGSMGDKPLNEPIVGMAATADGGGYWLVASDGGIFAFGNAQFYGSMGGKPLNEPIVSISPTPGGGGYTMVASDGGIFAFGASRFYGSLASVPLSRPVVTMAQVPAGGGYWFTDDNGAVSAFGDAGYYGSAPQVINRPIVGMAVGLGNGSFAGGAFQSDSYGYDISNSQCAAPLPPSPHTIGVVETNGWGLSAVNPCLSTEAAWAGGGLNLYTYLSCTDAGTTAPACTYTSGLAEGRYAYEAAKTAGVDTTVAWWLDVEGSNWSHVSTTANADVVEGALAALRAEGINSVGVYASPDVWGDIVGTYQPAVPYWVADWQVPPATACQDVHTTYRDVPAGPVVMVQYSSPSYPYAASGTSTAFDDDYAC